MYRPERQRNSLIEKVASKEARSTNHNKKPGKRLKRWRKWIESYKAIAAHEVPAPAAPKAAPETESAAPAS